MSFIGVISDNRFFENIKTQLIDINGAKIHLIHINLKSVENIKNIKFETVIIESSLEKFKVQEKIIEQICRKAKYIIVNTDINLYFNMVKEENTSIITYGLNQKAIVTISSITDSKILIYLQKNIKNINDKMIEVCEEQVKLEEKGKLKTYEILVIYIIFSLYEYHIMKEI